jgi:hypothetical protein
MTLARKTPMAPGKPLSRSKGLTRGRRPNPVNRERKSKAHAVAFGDEAKVLRELPCVALGHAGSRCSGAIEIAHVTARGMGSAKGDRFDIVPLCHAHHAEAGEARTSQREAFETRYGVNLRAEADRLAYLHEPPLGVRGLAVRFAYDRILREYSTAAHKHLSANKPIGESCPVLTEIGERIDATFSAAEQGYPRVTDREHGSLHAWVRRWIDGEVDVDTSELGVHLTNLVNEVLGAM